MSAKDRYGKSRQVRRQPVVLLWRAAQKSPAAHLSTGPGHAQSVVLPGVSVAGIRHADEATGQRLWFAQAAYLVYQAQCVVLHQVASAEPSKFLQQIRNMIKLFATENDFCSIVNHFLEPRQVFLCAVTVYRYAVADLRKNQGADQGGDDGDWQVTPEM